MSEEVFVLLMTILDLGVLQAIDSLDMVGLFGLCAPVEVNLIKKVLSSYIELKLWFPPKTID